MEAYRSIASVGWWTLGKVARRIILAWLYDRTVGSVFPAALFHATDNLSLHQRHNISLQLTA